MTGNRVPLSVKITIYHNVHEDAFFGLNAVRLPGGGTRQATAAERHPLVKVFTYDWDGLDRFGHPAEDAHIPLEMAFEEFNVGTGDLAQRYRDRRLRSLSVGDVVVVGETAWACASAGWTPVTGDALRILEGAEAEMAIRARFRFRPTEPLTITVPLEVAKEGRTPTLTTSPTAACREGDA